MQGEDCLVLFAKVENNTDNKKKQVMVLIVYLRDRPQSACSIMEDGG